MSSDTSTGFQSSPVPLGPCNCTETKDVLTDEEQNEFFRQASVKYQLERLKELKGNVIEIPENFLVELADIEECNENVESLRDCLQNETDSTGGKKY